MDSTFSMYHVGVRWWCDLIPYLIVSVHQESGVYPCTQDLSHLQRKTSDVDKWGDRGGHVTSQDLGIFSKEKLLMFWRCALLRHLVDTRAINMTSSQLRDEIFHHLKFSMYSPLFRCDGNDHYSILILKKWGLVTLFFYLLWFNSLLN